MWNLWNSKISFLVCWRMSFEVQNRVWEAVVYGMYDTVWYDQQYLSLVLYEYTIHLYACGTCDLNGKMYERGGINIFL